MKWVFFGGSEFSVYVLDELLLHNLRPDLIITTPDKPKGRKLVLTPTPVKIWAKEHDIEVIDPASLKKNNEDLVKKLREGNYDFFLVASYGKIIPKEIFDIPERKTLNIHPSMLPKYRGASPIQSQILNDEKNMGVTIMQIDEGMDTGPVVVQKTSPSPLLDQEGEGASVPSPDQGEGGHRVPGGVLGRKELEKTLATEGARLFAHVLPEWFSGVIDPIMQNEAEATYCEKIEKEDGELKIDLKNPPTGDEARKALLKIKAFEEWPTAYLFYNEKRIIITDATLDEKPPTSSGQVTLKILKVKPEGKNEMSYEDFLRGQR